MLCRMLVVSFMVVGCSNRVTAWEKNPTREYPVWISDSFQESHKSFIEQSVQSWERSLDGYLTFSFTDQHDYGIIHVHPSTIQDLQGHGPVEDGSKRIGYCKYHGIRSHVEIATDLDTADFRWVSLHEVGHALGLSHGEKNTVMCDRTSCGSQLITSRDVEQFHSVWETP